jgi:tetratricopeptide (TPR) repeat protein
VIEQVGLPVPQDVRDAAASPGLEAGGSTGAGAEAFAQDPVLMRLGVSALMGAAKAFEALERSDAAIGVWDEVAARFEQTTDLEILGQVAWAMTLKANTFWNLDRLEEAVDAFEELIARFAAATDPEVRLRVAWALWNESRILAELDRAERQFELYEQLRARHDEGLDPELADIVAWCISDRAAKLRDANEPEAALDAYSELIARFAGSTEAAVRQRVAFALEWKGFGLSRAGRLDEALDAYEQLTIRFRDEPSGSRARHAIASALWRRADVLEDRGRIQDAIAASDDALALLDGGTDEDWREQIIDLLGRKSQMLRRAERHGEAVVAMDEMVRRFEAWQGGRDNPAAVAAVAHTLVSNLSLLESQARDVPQRLEALLGDVADAPRAPKAVRAVDLPEDEIAALLASLWRDQTWLEFVSAADDNTSRDAAAARAVALYNQTATWLRTDVSAWDTPAAQAAQLIRSLADGYALCSWSWGLSHRENLCWPSRLMGEATMRELDIPEWTVTHGHPIEISDTDELAEELADDRRQQSATFDRDLPASFRNSLVRYEALEVMANSARGRQALQSPPMQASACWAMNDAHNTGAWVIGRDEDALGVAALGVLIAQAFFVATHSPTASSRDLFPQRSQMAGLLRESEALEWLDEHDIEIPDWITEQID